MKYNTRMLIAKNRKAHFDYEIVQKFTAGIVLTGYEVKAVREGKVELKGTFVQVIGGELYVVNMYIGRYSSMSQKYDEKDSRHSRKLL